jgi:hypothetical protein
MVAAGRVAVKTIPHPIAEWARLVAQRAGQPAT